MSCRLGRVIDGVRESAYVTKNRRKGRTMKRQAAGAVVAATAVLIAFPAIAAGGPTPAYTTSCAVGGTAGATWQHAKIVQVTIEWVAPAGTGVTFDPVVAPTPSVTPPRGFITTATPSVNGVAPASATFSFERKDGTVDTATVSCT